MVVLGSNMLEESQVLVAAYWPPKPCGSGSSPMTLV